MTEARISEDDGQSLCPYCVQDTGNKKIVCVHQSGSNGLARNCEQLTQLMHSCLHCTMAENMYLRNEVDVLRNKLTAKSQALEILKANEIVKHDTESDEKLTRLDTTKLLYKKIEVLKTELQLSKGALVSSQQVCRTQIEELTARNKALESEFNDQTTKLTKLLYENAYILSKQHFFARLVRRIHNSEETKSSSKTTKNTTVLSLLDENTPMTNELLFSCLDDEKVENLPQQLPAVEAEGKDRSPCRRKTWQNLVNWKDIFKQFRSQKSTSLLEKLQLEDVATVNTQIFRNEKIVTTTSCECELPSKSMCPCAVAAVNLKKAYLKLKIQCKFERRLLDQSRDALQIYSTALQDQFQFAHQMALQFTSILSAIPDRIWQSVGLNSFNMILTGETLQSNTPPSGLSTAPRRRQTGHFLAAWLQQSVSSLSDAASLASTKIERQWQRNSIGLYTVTSPTPLRKNDPSSKRSLMRGISLRTSSLSSASSVRPRSALILPTTEPLLPPPLNNDDALGGRDKNGWPSNFSLASPQSEKIFTSSSSELRFSDRPDVFLLIQLVTKITEVAQMVAEQNLSIDLILNSK